MPAACRYDIDGRCVHLRSCRRNRRQHKRPLGASVPGAGADDQLVAECRQELAGFRRLLDVGSDDIVGAEALAESDEQLSANLTG